MTVESKLIKVLKTKDVKLLQAGINQLLLMSQAESKEEFLLYVQAMNSLNIFNCDILSLIIRMNDTVLLKKAITLNVIRRKEK